MEFVVFVDDCEILAKKMPRYIGAAFFENPTAKMPGSDGDAESLRVRPQSLPLG